MTKSALLFSPAEVKAMYDEYVRGKSTAQLARERQASRQTIYRYFIRAGLLERRHCTVYQPHWTGEQLQQIHGEYLHSGRSLAQLARAYNTTPFRLIYAFRYAGLAILHRVPHQPRPEDPALIGARCPELKSKVRCADCPCPDPPCKPRAEWVCGDCTRRKQCPCWSPELRAQYNWEGIRREWQHGRRVSETIDRLVDTIRHYERPWGNL